MLKVPLTLVSPAGSRSRLSIMIFHRVLPQPDQLFPDDLDARAFETQMRWVRSWFNVLPLDAAVEMLYSEALPARALSITFDDGYADNAEVAAPILQRLGLTATFFVTTGFMSGGCMWNDRIIEAVRHCRSPQLDLRRIGFAPLSLATPADRRLSIMSLLNGIKHRSPDERAAAVEALVQVADAPSAPSLMMNAEQVKRLARIGMGVGAHTVTHPILTRLDSTAAKAEMLASKETLEQVLDRQVKLFAYPNGVPREDYAAEHVQMARACGFAAAVTTAWGAATATSDRYQLPRFTPWDRSRTKYGARLIWNLAQRPHATA